MSGVLLLILSILFLYLFKKKNQGNYWWLFAITLAFSLIGFTESIFETFFLEYHRGIIELIILAFFAFFFVPLLRLPSLWYYLKSRGYL